MPGKVRGLFYGDPGQLAANCIGILACVAWAGSLTYLALRGIDALVGNRVPPADEIGGLDVPEMGMEGYAMEPEPQLNGRELE